MPEENPIRERREAMRRDARVARWIKDHRTESTAEIQFGQFELLLRRMNLDVDRLLAIAKRQQRGEGREFEDALQTWIAAERKAGRPDTYVSTMWAALRSFLKHEEAAPTWAPKLKLRFGTTLLTEVVPTPEQLRAVLDRTPVHRIRAVILTLATSGVRPGVLGNRFGKPNGLRLSNLPELKLGSDGPHFERVPFKIEVPAELSKANNRYFTFASGEAAEEIVAYLKERLARGEKLTPSSALFAPEPKASDVHLRFADDGTAFISEKSIAAEVTRAFSKTRPDGVRWRCYVLRAFASSQLLVAESAGLITRDAREFALGHSADIGRRYNLGKGKVRLDLEEEVRTAWERAADRFLRILTLSQREIDYRPVLRVLLSSAGVLQGRGRCDGRAHRGDGDRRDSRQKDRARRGPDAQAGGEREDRGYRRARPMAREGVAAHRPRRVRAVRDRGAELMVPNRGRGRPRNFRLGEFLAAHPKLDARRSPGGTLDRGLYPGPRRPSRRCGLEVGAVGWELPTAADAPGDGTPAPHYSRIGRAPTPRRAAVLPRRPWVMDRRSIDAAPSRGEGASGRG